MYSSKLTGGLATDWLRTLGASALHSSWIKPREGGTQWVLYLSKNSSQAGEVSVESPLGQSEHEMIKLQFSGDLIWAPD